MFDELIKLNIKTCSDSELIAGLRQALPAIIEAYKRLHTREPMSCHNCLRKVECDNYNRNKTEITCLLLEPFLPGKYEGTGYREKNAGLMIEEYADTDEFLPEDAGDDDFDIHTKPDKSVLKAIRKTRLDEEFLLYKNCPLFIFRPEQWEAVCLRFEHGLKQRQIAKTLGISRTAVSDRLRRAQKNMKKYYEKNSNVIPRQSTSISSTNEGDIKK